MKGGRKTEGKRLGIPFKINGIPTRSYSLRHVLLIRGSGEMTRSHTRGRLYRHRLSSTNTVLSNETTNKCEVVALSLCQNSFQILETHGIYAIYSRIKFGPSNQVPYLQKG